jgi:hypothetical protein
MQTFLPYSDFAESAKCLDYRRLGKQRVETLQLLNSITGKTKGRGWTNHPCKHMWSENIAALVKYGLVICTEWLKRGYKDTCYDKIAAFGVEESPEMPWWFGNERLHVSHRSNLLRKDNTFYRQHWVDCLDDLPYIWPNNKTRTFYAQFSKYNR